MFIGNNLQKNSIKNMTLQKYSNRLAIGIVCGSLIGLNTAFLVQANPLCSSLIAQTSTTKGQTLTPTILGNATYQIPDRGSVTLTNGQYQGDQFTVTLGKAIAIGDLNQDGTDDAAVILAVETGGSGTFMYLAAVTQSPTDNLPSNPDTYFLGDRVQIKSLKINNGAIRIKMLKAKPTDPMCCPTNTVIEAYQLNNTAGTLSPITLTEKDKQQILIEDIPSPALGDGDNVPTAPGLGEIQIKF
jgi:hypothetical protein